MKSAIRRAVLRSCADHQVAAAVLGVDLADQLAEQRRADRVEAGVGLVEHHDRRFQHQRPGEPGALAHPAGELVRHLVGRLGEADLLEPPVDDLADLLLAFVGVLAQREGDVVVDVHRAEQRPVLEQQAELFAHLEELVVGHVRDRFAVHEDVARVGVEQPDDVLDQHALAGPRRAEHHRDLVLGEAEVEAVEDAGAAELFDQVDDLDRVLAAVVALAAGVEAVRDRARAGRRRG